MSVIFLLIPLSIVIGTVFLLAFVWAVRSGQYEDTETPSLRILLQDGVTPSGRGFAPERAATLDRSTSQHQAKAASAAISATVLSDRAAAGSVPSNSSC